MGGLKILLGSMAISLAFASGASASDRLFQDFAICLGRLSAELEHRWLMQDPASAETERARDAFADLLDALTTPDAKQEAMALRINSKYAHAMLLRRSVFETHSDQAAWARQRARRNVAACISMLPHHGDRPARA